MLVTTTKEQKKAARAARAVGGYDRLASLPSKDGSVLVRHTEHGRFVVMRKSAKKKP